MDYQKYLPLGIIAGILLYAIYKIQGNTAQVINRAVSFGSSPATPDERDPYRAAGFAQLANVATAQASLTSEIERSKLSAQTALDLQRERGANILAQLDILGRYKAFDVSQQLAAQNRLFDRQDAALRREQIARGISQTLGALLGGLSGRGSGGGSSGGYGTPPFNPNTNRRNNSAGSTLNPLQGYLQGYWDNLNLNPLEYAWPEFDIGGLFQPEPYGFFEYWPGGLDYDIYSDDPILSWEE